MRNWSTAAARWIRGLVGPSQGTKTPDFPGKPGILPGALAIRAVETQVADVLVSVASPAATATEAARHDALESAVINAFGTAVAEVSAANGAAAIQIAIGASMTGARASAFVSGDGLSAAREALSMAVARHVPIVVFAINQPATTRANAAAGAHEALHAIAETGAFVVVAKDVQHAVDLALVARRVAELALVPAVVALDAAEIAHGIQDFALPEGKLVKTYLGQGSAKVAASTPAQQLVFGEERARVPRWFDPDRPAAHGVVLEGADYAAATASSRFFFADDLGRLAEAAGAEYEQLTGRAVTGIARHKLDKASTCFVAQGALIEAAIEAADFLRDSAKAKVGVLGIQQLRPLAEEAITAALEEVERIVVLERAVRPGSAGPLTRELAAILGRRRLVTVYCGLGGEPVEAAAIAAAWRVAQDGTDGPLWLGIHAPAAKSAFPKRQVLLQSLTKSYAKAMENIVALDGVSPKPTKGVTSAAILASTEQVPADALTALAAELTKGFGGNVRAHSTAIGSNGWLGVVSASKSPLREVAEAGAFEMVVVDAASLRAELNPVDMLGKKGVLAVATGLLPADLWSALQPSWRAAVRADEIQLLSFDGSLAGLIEQVPRVLKDKLDRMRTVSWSGFQDPETVDVDRPLPLAVRRFASTDRAYDTVARFWGEVVQPRAGGERVGGQVDPWLALDALPPSTATFHDLAGTQASIASIDANTCTGCGACWTVCPDAAIGANVLTTLEALDAAEARSVDPAAEPDPIAGKLKRAHKQLASKVTGLFAKAEPGVADLGLVREGFDWLVDKMNVSDDEKPGFQAAFEATFAQLGKLPLTLSEPIYFAAHKQDKGNGGLLALAVNPQACKACGVCVQACADDAIAMADATPATIAAARQRWDALEELPDTAGTTITRTAANPDVGPLAAILTSRHCQMAMASGDQAEPGSGARLALRQVAAVVEFDMQRRMLEQVAALDALSPKVRKSIRVMMSDAVPVDNLDALDEALSDLASRNTKIKAIVGRLEEIGERTEVDGRMLRKLVRTSKALEHMKWELLEGAHGVGRARLGVVVTGESTAAWAGAFPYNVFSGPALIDLTGDGAALSVGIAEGLLGRRVHEVRKERLAALLLAPPSDLPEREAEIAGLTWQDLSAEELASTPPLLLVGSSDALQGAGLAGVTALLASGMPVKIVVLDEADLLSSGPELVSVALTQRDAYVASTSLAHHDHLMVSVSEALAYPGPALISVYCPSPQRHGVSIDAILSVASLAVSSRVHPLMRYNPLVEGVFGRRMTLEGNPEPTAILLDDEAGDPSAWVRVQRRFGGHLAPVPRDVAGMPLAHWVRAKTGERVGKIATLLSENGELLVVAPALARALANRLGRWKTWQELAGVVTPFTAEVRAQIEAEVRTKHIGEIAELHAQHATEVAEVKRRIQAEQAEKLRERLMQLTGMGQLSTRARQGGEAS